MTAPLSPSAQVLRDALVKAAGAAPVCPPSERCAVCDARRATEVSS